MNRNTPVPKFIKDYGLNFKWNKNKLWDLKNIPVEIIDISEIEWQLDLPFWHDNNKKYCISPRMVLNNIELYPKQKERILNADTNYPIDLIKNINGRLEILDGLHRLCRLIIENNTIIKVRKISRDLIPQIIDED